MRGQLNILISGGTGTGKTTLLNVLSAFMPEDERIVTIEDAAELQLQQPHVVRLETRPANIEGQGEITIRDLVRNALRMRPDRIIVGEVRGAEALDMLQAMNTGHDGSLTTIHANTPRDALNRLETLVLMSGLDLPLHAIREQTSGALDVIIHLTRLVDGTRRVSHITEVLRMESDIITLQDVFVALPVDERSASLDAHLAAAAARADRPAAALPSQAGFGRRRPPDRLLRARARVGGERKRERERELAMSTALFDSSWGLIAVCIAVGCLVLAAALVATARPRGAWLRDRLGPYGGPEEEHTRGADAAWQVRMDQIFGATESRLGRTNVWKRVEHRLGQAGMDTRPAVIVWLSVVLGVLGFMLFGVFSGSFALGLVVACVLAATPFVVVSVRARRRMRGFDEQLPNVLQTMAGSLQVGHSFNQSLQAIVDEGQQPAADEFGRVIAEMRFGRPADDALEAVGKRLDSPDFDYVLMSVRVQRQIGGSLAGLFETVAETVRERQQFRRKLRAITATGRMSAYLLTCLPLATAALLTLIRPDYLAPLFTTHGGQVAIVVCCVMIVIGALSLRRIVDVKG